MQNISFVSANILDKEAPSIVGVSVKKKKMNFGAIGMNNTLMATFLLFSAIPF